MIVREFYRTRKDGVSLYRTYSDAGYLIRQTQTGAEYAEAIDVAGTPDNPIVWASGMALIQNAYYTHNGETKVWMGEAGKQAEWTDAAFVPI